VAATNPVVSPPIPARRALRRLPANARLITGVGILVGLLVMAFLVPVFNHSSPTALNPTAALLPPGPGHWLGTDQYGRDVLVRIAYGARLDFVFGLVPVLASLIIGTSVGLVSGYYGGAVDAILMRIVDVMFAFPYLVLVIAIIAIFGPGALGMMIAVVIVDWTVYARIIRAEVLSLKGQEFITAARLLGYSPARVLLRHVLPNVISPAVVYATVDVVNTILLAATLSFLGLGVQPPTPEWGAMISDAQNFIFQAWWMTVMPGLALVLTGVALSLVSDGLAEVIDRG
jgi:peptide/nickel transport system permease protein